MSEADLALVLFADFVEENSVDEIPESLQMPMPPDSLQMPMPDDSLMPFEDDDPQTRELLLKLLEEDAAARLQLGHASSSNHHDKLIDVPIDVMDSQLGHAAVPEQDVPIDVMDSPSKLPDTQQMMFEEIDAMLAELDREVEEGPAGVVDKSPANKAVDDVRGVLCVC